MWDSMLTGSPVRKYKGIAVGIRARLWSESNPMGMFDDFSLSPVGQAPLQAGQPGEWQIRSSSPGHDGQTRVRVIKR